jgi:hypothetical protein
MNTIKPSRAPHRPTRLLAAVGVAAAIGLAACQPAEPTSPPALSVGVTGGGPAAVALEQVTGPPVGAIPMPVASAVVPGCPTLASGSDGAWQFETTLGVFELPGAGHCHQAVATAESSTLADRDTVVVATGDAADVARWRAPLGYTVDPGTELATAVHTRALDDRVARLLRAGTSSVVLTDLGCAGSPELRTWWLSVLTDVADRHPGEVTVAAADATVCASDARSQWEWLEPQIAALP